MTADKIIHTDPDRIDFIDELRLVVLFAYGGCLGGRCCEFEEREVSGRFRIFFNLRDDFSWLGLFASAVVSE